MRPRCDKARAKNKGSNTVLLIKEKDEEFFILFFYEINAKKLCFVGCVKEVFERNAEDLG